MTASNEGQSGPDCALLKLLAEQRPRLLAYLQRQIGPRLRGKVEPDDILQETTLEALRRVNEFNLLERDPFGWLCQIAERRLIDVHRRLFQTKKRGGAREISLDEARDSGGDFAELLIASLTTASRALSHRRREARLQSELAGLPEETREVLRLRYVEGLRTKEIAGRLGKTDGAVRVLLTRSVQRLQAQLKESAEPG